MTCTDTVCGTGIVIPSRPGPPGPPPPPGPGEPIGGMALTASAAYGGIQVSWTYPSINSYAVAHFLVYRNTSADPTGATEIAVISGSRFFDSIATATTYYYWIKVVSIYGNQGALIGPASATSRDRGADTIDDIQGRIVDGVLDTALRQDIAKITLNYQELMTEIGNRVAGNAALSAALADLQNGLEETVAFVNTEITTRQEGDSALASEVGIIAAANANNAAAIIEERIARVTKDDALTTQYNAVFAATNNNAAAITSETTARTNAISALASKVDTVQTTLGDQIASVQVGAQTQIGQINGKIAEIGALWTARVSVNGLVGGFGIYNNGQYVEAGFDVDTFWVGRTTADKIKPFVINNGKTYIDSAMIREATITSAKIGHLEVGTSNIANQAVTEVWSLISAEKYQMLYLSVTVPSGANVVELDVSGQYQYAGIRVGQSVFALNSNRGVFVNLNPGLYLLEIQPNPTYPEPITAVVKVFKK